MHKHLRTTASLQWIMLPLRLFLGITFLYAGLQKLSDAQFLHPGSANYIGTQIVAFAVTSPLHTFLLQFVAVHALFFGVLILIGEIAIGLGVLLGFLLRPAAFFGVLLNVFFFLCVSWSISPYFYGSDIVFIFCWLPLLLNGPLHTGLPTIDEALWLKLLQRISSAEHADLIFVLSLLLGLPVADALSARQTMQPEKNEANESSPLAVPVTQVNRPTRRLFLSGVVVGGIGTLLVVAFERGIALISASSKSRALTSQPATTLIAQAADVSVNSSVRFTIPDNDNPGVLVHLHSGDFVAYNALCTHANCQVEYNASSQLLVCPCHGSTFDPARKGAVTQAPATKPLIEIPINVDVVSGVITFK